MSNYLAIGGVSATLRRLLKDRMPQDLGTVSFEVTVSSPRADSNNGDSTEDMRVNLFLYRVTENGSLKNQEILGEGHPGAYGHPPLSLNLHYLLTAYGTTSDGDSLVNQGVAQQLLGSAMRVLHDHAIITEQLLTTQDPQDELILDLSLRDQFERMKITLDPLSLEDISKIWTALTLPYRVSAGYTVNVVQIESRRQRRLAMPVTTRRVHVTTLRRPEIVAVYRKPEPNEPIGDQRVKLGQSITIEGANFIAAKTWVRIERLEPIRVAPVSSGRIEIAVPDSDYPVDLDHPATRPIPAELRLWPGAQRVEVWTEQATEVVQGGLDNGKVVADKNVRHSNRAVFVLVPEISSADPSEVATAALPGPVLTVSGKRLYRPDLKSLVLVGDVAIEVRRPIPPDAWDEPEESKVQVPLAALANLLPAANDPYPVRVMVNGAQSIDEGNTLTIQP